MTNADDPALSTLGALLKANDLGASDLLNAIAALANTKKNIGDTIYPKKRKHIQDFSSQRIDPPKLYRRIHIQKW